MLHATILQYSLQKINTVEISFHDSLDKTSVAAFALEALSQHRTRQLEIKRKAGSFWEEYDYVFCTLVGTHLRPNHVVDDFKKLLKKAGLPGIRFHDLRHSAATFLLSLGVHAKVVQEMLGHTQIGMMMDIYSHVLSSMQQEDVSKLNNLLMRPGSGDDLEDG